MSPLEARILYFLTSIYYTSKINNVRFKTCGMDPEWLISKATAGCICVPSKKNKIIFRKALFFE